MFCYAIQDAIPQRELQGHVVLILHLLSCCSLAQARCGGRETETLCSSSI